MRSSGRQPSCAAAGGHPTAIISGAFAPSRRWENQSWVMNWIQNAASTLKNGAFL
jgi:hypothetical protein